MVPAEEAVGWAAVMADVWVHVADGALGEIPTCGIYDAMGWAAMVAPVCEADEAHTEATVYGTEEGSDGLAEDAMGVAAAEGLLHGDTVQPPDEAQSSAADADQMVCPCTDTLPTVCNAPRCIMRRCCSPVVKPPMTCPLNT